MPDECALHGQSSSFLHLDRIRKLKTNIGRYTRRGSRGALGGPGAGRECGNEVNCKQHMEYPLPRAVA